jgi:hypothetical protein
MLAVARRDISTIAIYRHVFAVVVADRNVQLDFSDIAVAILPAMDEQI